MSFAQCRQCRLWVNRQEAFCPNCGIATPATTQTEVEWYAGQHLTALLAVCISLAIAVSIIRANSTLFGYGLGGTVILLSLAYYRVISWKIKQFSKISPMSLYQDESTIQQRLRELETRQTRIHDLLQRGVSEKTSLSQAFPLVETLKHALITLRIQHGQYRAKLWEIMLIRWSNRLKPLIENWQHTTYEQCQTYLQILSEMDEKGKALLQEWKTLSMRTEDENQSITHLQQALETIQELQQAVHAKQIAVTVQGISRFDDGGHMHVSRENTLAELEMFNSFSDVRVFSSSFQELEEEYFRLKSEDELYEEK